MRPWPLTLLQRRRPGTGCPCAVSRRLSFGFVESIWILAVGEIALITPERRILERVCASVLLLYARVAAVVGVVCNRLRVLLQSECLCPRQQADAEPDNMSSVLSTPVMRKGILVVYVQRVAVIVVGRLFVDSLRSGVGASHFV